MPIGGYQQRAEPARNSEHYSDMWPMLSEGCFVGLTDGKTNMSEFSIRSAPYAPSLQVDQWLNTSVPPALEQLRGKVVMLHAFQMLCPGCVNHGLPQAEKVHRLFRQDDVVVIGLHTVFEHHAVMGPDALQAFIHEYRWSFPIGIDRASESGAIPMTMRAYHLEGTPSIVLLDKLGRIRLQQLGHIDDLRLGMVIGRLLTESLPDNQLSMPMAGKSARGCGPDACVVPDS